MSRSEIERFDRDLATNVALQAEIRRHNRLEATVGIAARHGYGFTLEEAAAFFRERAKAPGKGLSEADLAAVVGGASPGQYPGWPPPPLIE